MTVSEIAAVAVAIVEVARSTGSKDPDDLLDRTAFEVLEVPYDAEPEDIQIAYTRQIEALRPFLHSDSQSQEWLQAMKCAYRRLRRGGYVS